MSMTLSVPSTATTTAMDPSTTRPRFRLQLLRRFGLQKLDPSGDGSPIDVHVPTYVQRLLAFLAVTGSGVDRVLVAGSLWLDAPEERAAGSLRTALWKLRGVDADIVHGDGRTLALGTDVAVDLHETVRRARVLLTDVPFGVADYVDADELSVELLPEWYDDWVIVERERFRQLRLHALEALSLRLSRADRHAAAIDAAQAAIAAEPLRESAQRVLISVHLAEGNRFEARRQLERYAALVRSELGAEPSAELQAIVADAFTESAWR